MLRARLGEGGMGRVYLAQSPGGRLVAVKVIHSHLAEDNEFRARFAREVTAARKVSGMFTAAVVGDELDGPVPWVATAYVPGPSLAAAVRQHGPLPLTLVTSLAAGLAEGLSAIHAAGVIHRDLTPWNIILAQDGPRIIDFGISSAAGATSLTGSGSTVGSPGFMSPEQAEGQRAGPASDIFSLGAVLTFAAKGEGPFGSGTAAALLQRVVEEQPDTDGVPDALRPLLMRCMDIEPARRPTATEILAEVTSAYPSAPGMAGWLPVWTFGSPSGSSGSTGSSDDSRESTGTAATAPGPDGPPVPSTETLSRLPQPAASDESVPPWPYPGVAAGPPGTAPVRRRRGRLPVLAIMCALIVGAGSISYVLTSLVKPPAPAKPASPAKSSSGLAHASSSPSHPGPQAYTREDIFTESSAVSSLAFSPSGATLAGGVGQGGAAICLWHFATGTCANFTSAYSVAFSPDGKTLAAAWDTSGHGNLNGIIRLWNVATARQTAMFTDPASEGAFSVAFSPDGSTLAVADGDGSTYLWDVATRKISATFRDPSIAGVTSVAFGLDGTVLATGDANGSTYLWDVATKKRIATFGGPASNTAVYSVAFHGTTLAVGAANGSTYLWDVATKSRIATLTDPAATGCVCSVAVSPDGKTLAAGDGHGSTYLWNLATERVIAALADPSGTSIDSVAFSPNGKALATGDANGSAYLWVSGLCPASFAWLFTAPRRPLPGSGIWPDSLLTGLLLHNLASNVSTGLLALLQARCWEADTFPRLREGSN